MGSKLEELLVLLRAHSVRLNSISEPSPSATVFYEIMSGALVWSDEKIERVPTEVIWALRPLFGYRSSLIKGAPLQKWRPYWEECQLIFPRWIGFHADRAKSTPELLRILKLGEKKLERCLKETK
jgi:hypothetical protein